jgi:hypothetical protein
VGSLKVVVDGASLSEVDARSFWQRFSAWMEAHEGDLAGFARSEGLASVHPEIEPEGASLVGSRTAPQKPYAKAAPSRGPQPPRRRR